MLFGVVAGGPAWLLAPHPDAPPISAIDNASTSKPPNRRLRGNMSRSSDAMVTPEPAAYHGVLPSLCCASIVPESTCPGKFGKRRFAVMPDKVSVVVCATVLLAGLKMIVAGLKLKVGR